MLKLRIKSDSILFLVICIACGHFLVDFMLSIWPVYKTMVRIDLAVASIVAALAIASGELMQVFFGKLIDQGYQRYLLIAGPLFAASSAFFPYTNNIYVFLLILFFTAIGSAAFHPTAASILGGIHSSKKFLLLGIFQAAGMVGMGVGQFCFTQTFFNLSGHTMVLAIPAILLGVVVIGLSHGHLKKETHHKEPVSLKVAFRFFREKYLRSLYFIQLGHQTLFWAVIFLLPDILLKRNYDTWITYGGGHFFWMIGSGVSCLLFGYLSHIISPVKIILNCYIAAFILFFLFMSVPTMSEPVVLSTLFGIGLMLGGLNPLSIALGVSHVPNNRGMVSAFLMGFVWIISEGLGIGLSCILADFFEENGPEKSLLIIGTIAFIPGVISAFKLFRMGSKKEDTAIEKIEE